MTTAFEAPPSVFEPIGEIPRRPGPTATIDPDQTKSWIRRCWPIIGSHRARFTVALVGAFIALLLQVVIPQITKGAIDQALIKRTDALSTYVWLLLGIGLGRAILTYIYRQALYRTAFDIENDLRSLMYRHFSRLSFDFFDRVQSGQLISRANSDIRTVQNFLTFSPIMALSFVSFFFALAFMAKIHVGLTLVAMSTIPGVYLSGVKLRNITFPMSWLVQARTADIATIVDENVTGVRVVRSFAAEDSQIQELAASARRLRWASIVLNNARSKYGPLMENLPRIGLAAVLLYGGKLAIDGEVSIGTLVAFNTYVVMLQMPFRLLGFIMMLGQRASASAQRIFEVLDEAPSIVERPGAVDLMHPQGRVEFNDVSFRYPAETEGPLVLEHFSLTVEPGETVAIVGRTGSGKSTIARLVPRFYDVADGAVLLDGHDVRDLTLPSLRAAVSMVLDEPFLFSASIHDNIAYARPDAGRADVERAARAAQAHNFIMDLPEGYESVIGERGYTLSGGQRQRLAIARTLLADPSVLILDDATSAIDVGLESKIHEALTALTRDRTTIVIAHRLSTISLATRVALLEDGRVIASGTHFDLLRDEPRYRAVLATSVEDDL